VTTGMTNAQVRVIDPILGTVALGYRNAELVGQTLFPYVDVDQAGGQILEFGKEAFKRYNLRRTPGAATARVGFGYLGKPYSLFQDSLEVPVPREHVREAQVPGIDLGIRATNQGMRIATLALEIEQAGIATNPANYDNGHKKALSSAAKWTDPAGKPTTDIEDAKEAVRASIGMDPNTVMLSAKAMKACKANPQILDRIKYTGRDTVTPELLADLWEVERVVVGKAVTFDDKGTTPADVWGNNAVIAYAPATPAGQEEPSYGYTYRMRGHPLVEEAYYERQSKSWIYGVTLERAPVLTGMVAGFLIQNPA
jgi:hypothetical protein